MTPICSPCVSDGNRNFVNALIESKQFSSKFTYSINDTINESNLFICDTFFFAFYANLRVDGVKKAAEKRFSIMRRFFQI